MNDHRPIRRVGSLWKPKSGSKSVGSGTLTINGQRQRFVIMANRDKAPNSKQPDYVLLSSDDPELDPYAGRHAPPLASSAPLTDEDIPF